MTAMEVSLSPSEASPSCKCKGKELSMGPPKKPQVKMKETSSTAVAKVWKLEFFAFELGRQVMVVDSTKDHNTNVALARAIILPNDVAVLSEEDTKMMRSLLVMQDVQVSDMTSVFL